MRLEVNNPSQGPQKTSLISCLGKHVTIPQAVPLRNAMLLVAPSATTLSAVADMEAINSDQNSRLLEFLSGGNERDFAAIESRASAQ